MEDSGAASRRVAFLGGERDGTHSLSFGGRSRKTQKRSTSFVVLSIAVLCFVSIIFCFFCMHFSLFSSIEDEFSEANVGRASVDGEEEVVSDDTQIWKWPEPKFVQKFQQFMADYKKVYHTEAEKAKRYAIFKRNLYFVHTHNEQGYTYSLKMNEFGDLTREEFSAKYLGYKKDAGLLSRGVDVDLLNASDDDLPSAVDWKEKKCVTPIKDQKQCGSCWAFSSTGALEGAYCAKTGKLLNLSEQQLVDCAREEGNMGCNGGDMGAAFQYVIRNQGLCSEEDYPYTAKDGTCKSTKCQSAIQITGYKDVPRENVSALKSALVRHGPVSVAIQADQMQFQFYHKGVFTADCGTLLNHGVLAVGYGHDKASALDFWEIKNSWGVGWGEQGFMRMIMNKGKSGECGILLGPTYPII